MGNEANMPQDVLKIESVTLDFGGLRALSNVDITIEPGLITSVIGPNGAGKTSLLNCIPGFTTRPGARFILANAG